MLTELYSDCRAFAMPTCDGERLRQAGFTEVGGVCTHPDGRVQVPARLLSPQPVADVHQGKAEQVLATPLKRIARPLVVRG
jgi:hypothetical protein